MILLISKQNLSIVVRSLAFALLLLGCSKEEPVKPEPAFTNVPGKWNYSLHVPPTATGVHNSIVFTGVGSDTEGTFLDKNGHSGDWHMESDSIFWTYLNVPGLTNLYKGKVSADFKTMEGTHSGVFNGNPYTGRWTGTKSSN